MNLRRGDSGQTATEYLGVIVVVAAIVAALMATDVGAKVAGGLEAAICSITGGACETGDGDVADAGETPVRLDTEGGGGGGTPEGPESGDGEFPVGDVPWDGSVSLNGSTNDGNGLYLDATISESESQCTLDEDGNPVVDLDVSGQLKAGARADATTKTGTGVGVDGYVGNGISYGISTDPETADDLQDGTLPTPSPVNPLTIPEGTALTLTESSYKGLDLSAAYRGVQATLGYERGTEVSSAVERVDGDTVRVTVGDADYVEQGLGLGVGVANAGVSRKGTSAKAKQVDIDVSTPAGQRAYAAFIETGKLPTTGTGVSGTTDITSYTTDDALSAGFDLGPFEGSLDSNQTGSATTVTHPDGTKTYTSYNGGQDVTKATTWTEDAEGNETQAPTTTITYGSTDEGYARALVSAFTGEEAPDYDGDQDVSVTLSEADIAALQQAAKDAHDYQLEQTEVDDMELENLATLPPGQVPIALQMTPSLIFPLLQKIRGGAVQASGWERGDPPPENVLPDVDPAAVSAACS